MEEDYEESIGSQDSERSLDKTPTTSDEEFIDDSENDEETEAILALIEENQYFREKLNELQ